jgi:hypothetical protein
MTWRYSEAGKEIGCPSSEHGLCIDGPLTTADWKVIVGDILDEMIEQAKREALAEYNAEYHPSDPIEEGIRRSQRGKE